MDGEFKVGGRVVGRVEHYRDAPTFITHRNVNNFLRTFQGFGINKDVIDTLEAKRINQILIVYHSSKGKKHYFALLRTWLDKGRPYKHPNYDEQLILPETDFDKVDIER